MELVRSCFKPLQHINIQVELQPCKMRLFSLSAEDIILPWVS